MKKILIINPFGIGDVLFTTPVIKNLRLKFPEAKIAYLANGRTSDFLKLNPDIAQVFVYERDEFVKVYRQNPMAFFRKWFAFYQAIRRENFDVVFDYSFNTTFGFLSAISGIRRRIGYDYRGRGRFLTDKIEFKGFEDKHVVDYFLDLLKCVDVPIQDPHLVLNVPAEEVDWAREWLGQHEVDKQKPLIALFPGGGASWGSNARFRQWGAANYAQLADKIIENFDAEVILLGDSKDEPLCREIVQAANFPMHSAVGQTSLLGLAAIFKQCRAAIINDSGSVHVAAAVGTKALSIFGPVDPKVYGPYPAIEHKTVQKGLPCQPCYRRFHMPQCSHISCLRDLSVEEVYRKVKSIL